MLVLFTHVNAMAVKHAHLHDDKSHGTRHHALITLLSQRLRGVANYTTQHIKLHNNPYREGAVLNVHYGNYYSKDMVSIKSS